MSTYASLADFSAYTDMDPEPDPAVVQKALDRAEFDVDYFLPGPVDPDTGLRLNIDNLAMYQLQHLVNAVCAQAEYRINNPEFFRTGGNSNEVIQGPDFTISGTRRWFSVTAARYLMSTGIMLMGARAVP